MIDGEAVSRAEAQAGPPVCDACPVNEVGHPTSFEWFKYYEWGICRALSITPRQLDDMPMRDVEDMEAFIHADKMMEAAAIAKAK